MGTSMRCPPRPRRKNGLARAGALLVAGSAAALSMLPGPEAEADCNRNCAPGVEPDARGCCPVAPGPVTGGPGPAASKAACPDGKERNDDTAGHCCWNGQVWTSNKCMGVPRACPKSTHVDRTKESCEQDACPSGMVAPANAKNECCWPGQAWSKVNGVCVGTPRCPKGFEARGDTCADLEAERRAAEARAQREQERIEREKREAADRAERDRKAAAERAEREKREAAERVEREKREAEARAKAELARQEEQRRMEHAARLSEATQKAADARGSGKVALGFGIGSVALSGLFMGLGAMQNGSIHNGGFGTGADIQSAADKGKAFNITAAAFGAAGGVLIAVAIPVIAVNHEPKDSDVALTLGPFGGGVRGSF